MLGGRKLFGKEPIVIQWGVLYSQGLLRHLQAQTEREIPSELPGDVKPGAWSRRLETNGPWPS